MSPKDPKFDSCPRPETCVTEGMNCENCVRANARHVALLCPGLSHIALRSVFSRLYEQSFCESEFLAFEIEYGRRVRIRTHAPACATTAA